MQGSPLWWWWWWWWWYAHSSLTVFVLAAGTSITSPCCVTRSPATWVSGSTSSAEPHGRPLSICVMDAHPPRTSCPPATTGMTGPVSPWPSSWTARPTWPTTGKCACWPTSAWLAATTCPQWTRASATTSSWAAPWATWRTWLSTAWRSSNARRSTCLSGRSACASSRLSHRSTAREPPTWTWASSCADALRSSTSWTCNCTSTPRTCSSSVSSSPARGSTRKCAWRGARKGAGWGSRKSKQGHGRPNTEGEKIEAGGGEQAGRKGLKVTSPPPPRTTRAKWPVGEALVLRERSKRQIAQRLFEMFPLTLPLSLSLCHILVSLSFRLTFNPSPASVCFSASVWSECSAVFLVKTAKSVSLTAALPWSALWCLKSLLNAVYIFVFFIVI